MPKILQTVLTTLLGLNFVKKKIQPASKKQSAFIEKAKRKTPKEHYENTKDLSYLQASVAILVIASLLSTLFIAGPFHQYLHSKLYKSELVFLNGGQAFTLVALMGVIPFLFMLMIRALGSLSPSLVSFSGASSTLQNLIFLGEIKKPKNKIEKIKALNEIEKNYNTSWIYKQGSIGLLKVALVVILLSMPLIPLGLRAHIKVSENGITYRGALHFQKQTLKWNEINMVSITSESNGENTNPKILFELENGKNLNIWDTALVYTETKKLLSAIELAEKNDVFIWIDPMPHIEDKQKRHQKQIQAIFNYQEDLSDF